MVYVVLYSYQSVRTVTKENDYEADLEDEDNDNGLEEEVG